VDAILRVFFIFFIVAAPLAVVTAVLSGGLARCEPEGGSAMDSPGASVAYRAEEAGPK
jgi:hypothetical protein